MAALTKPVKLIDDLAELFGVESKVSVVCTASSINKWSKNKPIRYYDGSGIVTRELNANERRGMVSEISAGYAWGVKLAAGTGKFEDVHDISFEYHRPRGTGQNEMYRMLDFYGYDHAAVPNLSGYLPDRGTFDVEHSFDAQVIFDSAGVNTTGLDIATEVQTESGYSLADCYPFVLVSNTAKTQFYAAALFNTNVTNPQTMKNLVTKLKYNNAWQRDFFCNFSTFPYKSSGNWLVSLFITYKFSQDLDIKVDGSWFNVQGRLFTAKPYGLPNAIGKIITMSSADTTPDITSVTYRILTNRFGISNYTLNPYPQSGQYYVRLHCRLSRNGSSVAEGYSDYFAAKTAASGMFVRPSIDLKTGVLDPAGYVPMPGTTFTVDAWLEIGTVSGSTFTYKKQSSVMTDTWTYNN